MSARKNNGKQGNAALWIILAIFILGNPILGIFFLIVGGLVWYAKKNFAAKDADPDQPAQRRQPEPDRRQTFVSAAKPTAFQAKKKPAVSTPTRTPSKPARPSAQQHDHIQSICLDQKARLEQLETLKKAGLYSNEEYKAKREEILRS